jgi:ABC-type polar amino acid transport system ATPase subunit
MNPIVRVSNLDKYFGRDHILKDLSFEVKPTEVICIIGPSGSGKSTLLRCINFLEEPDHGEIEVDGVMVETPGAGKAYRRHIHALRLKTGMVFQQFNLFPHMTSLENVVEGPIRVKRIKKAEALQIGLHNLEKVGLIDKRDEYPSRLSGGQQQRVAIARAISMQPQVMLFDEPTSSLDPELIGEVVDAMQQLVEEGMTMLIATHNMVFTRQFSHRIMFMDAGRFAEIGPPVQLFENPKDERTRTFLSAFASSHNR